MSSTSVLLPLPETPVTHVIRPSGKRASTLFRLFSAAPKISSHASPGVLRSVGTAICFSPLRNCAVREVFDFSSSGTVPAKTTSPPCTPAAGPRSMT